VPLSTRLLRFGLAVGITACVTAVLMSGVTPPGACGEVLRHNRECDIDASPLFYSDVEDMRALERAVTDRRDTRAATDTTHTREHATDW